MNKLLIAACFLPAATALADWPTDAGQDVPVGTLDTSATPSVIADQQGGVFVVFAHADQANAKTLRGEHFDSQGNRLWSTAIDGGYLGKDLLNTTLGTATYNKALAFSDNLGGFIAAYTPGNSGGPFTLSLQRFDATGAPMWTATSTNGGVQLFANPEGYSDFFAVPDQTGGALVTFLTPSGFLGQRLDQAGTTKYGSGFLFANGQGSGDTYAPPFLGGDGTGGMYYIYAPSGSETISAVADYVTPTGTLGFSVPSVAPLMGTFGQWSVAGLPSAAGAWVTWYQGGVQGELYLQRFLGDGGVALPDAGPAGGLLAATTANTAPTPVLINDGQGGVVMVWFDQPAPGNVLYAQHFGPDGATLWGPVMVSSSASTPAAESSYLPSFRVVATPDNDVAVFWNAQPNGIYGEKLDMATGARLWGPLTGGVLISNAGGFETPWLDVTFASDQSAYVTYQVGTQVFLKHVLPNGALGTVAADAGTSTDAGNPLDAGLTNDAGITTDGGPTEDAGPTDAGIADSGVRLDAGAGTDGGILGADGGAGAGDAGFSGPDAGSTIGKGSSGCGCTSGSDGALWMGLLGAASLVRSRRKASEAARVRLTGGLRATP